MRATKRRWLSMMPTSVSGVKRFWVRTWNRSGLRPIAIEYYGIPALKSGYSITAFCRFVMRLGPTSESAVCPWQTL